MRRIGVNGVEAGQKKSKKELAQIA